MGFGLSENSNASRGLDANAFKQSLLQMTYCLQNTLFIRDTYMRWCLVLCLDRNNTSPYTRSIRAYTCEFVYDLALRCNDDKPAQIGDMLLYIMCTYILNEERLSRFNFSSDSILRDGWFTICNTPVQVNITAFLNGRITTLFHILLCICSTF